ncbi:unnamed protein product [Pleuronectes platessa]|uniref:Uncharacterized protein n=1 Tax=Pleuronectes platessa TaxID=8262 RepID=A0A9N7VQP1_PLEPL|nr:unnamed protein product [Pleuronectes platessa]
MTFHAPCLKQFPNGKDESGGKDEEKHKAQTSSETLSPLHPARQEHYETTSSFEGSRRREVDRLEQRSEIIEQNMFHCFEQDKQRWLSSYFFIRTGDDSSAFPESVRARDAQRFIHHGSQLHRLFILLVTLGSHGPGTIELIPEQGDERSVVPKRRVFGHLIRPSLRAGTCSAPLATVTFEALDALPDFLDSGLAV